MKYLKTSDAHFFARNLYANVILLLCILAFILSCISLPEEPEEPYNIYDPNNPDYISPEVILTSGPQQNETISSDQVTFRWQGNQNDMEFRYQLDEQNWSEFAARTEVTFAKLNEFAHQFNIQGRYISMAESDILEIPFVVNAIQGPALFVHPKHQNINSGAEFSIELWADDIPGFNGFSTRIQFAPAQLMVQKVDYLGADGESLLLANGGQLVTFSEIKNTQGYVQMDCAVVENSPHDVTGTGKVARVVFKHLQGSSSQITVTTDSYLQNSIGQSVPINNLVGGEVVVK